MAPGLRTTMGKPATREQGYAFQRPSLTRKKIRGLELRAGAQRQPGRRDLPTKNTYSQAPNAPANANSPNKPRSPTAASSPTGRLDGASKEPHHDLTSSVLKLWRLTRSAATSLSGPHRRAPSPQTAPGRFRGNANRRTLYAPTVTGASPRKRQPPHLYATATPVSDTRDTARDTLRVQRPRDPRRGAKAPTESNRCTRLCRPLRSHSATAPGGYMVEGSDTTGR